MSDHITISVFLKLHVMFAVNISRCHTTLTYINLPRIFHISFVSILISDIIIYIINLAIFLIIFRKLKMASILLHYRRKIDLTQNSN